MKIYFRSIYNHTKNTIPLSYALRPSFKKYWSGKIIHIGTNSFYMVIDLRGINNIQDFADALGKPNVWHILKKFRN